MRRKILGIGFVILGIIALITPLTPGSWLVFIGLEFLGIRILFWKRFKEKYLVKAQPEQNPPEGDSKY